MYSCQRHKEATDLLSEAIIQIEGDSIKDFGTYHASQGEKKVAHFVIRNIGNDPLIIQHINTGCGCTTAFFRKEPISPNDTAHIDAVYDGTGLAYGTFFKEISVTTNAKSGLLKLAIKGNRLQ